MQWCNGKSSHYKSLVKHSINGTSISSTVSNPVLSSVSTRTSGNIGSVHFEVHTDEHGQIVNIQQSTIDLLHEDAPSSPPLPQQSAMTTVILDTVANSDSI